MGQDELTRRDFLKTAAYLGAAAVIPCDLAFADEQAAKPNILFFFPDQHRHDWLQTSAGIPVRTPNLTALAKRGIRFNWAFTPSPVCAPARACLAAG